MHTQPGHGVGAPNEWANTKQARVGVLKTGMEGKAKRKKTLRKIKGVRQAMTALEPQKRLKRRRKRT